MKNFRKYAKQYFLPPDPSFEWAKKDAPDRAPAWCSVDLRDGNQALAEPMSLSVKTEFFHLLVDLGFKEIEVGFPAASDTEFAFVRKLIGEKLIPDGVTVQVLTQAREHIIRRTFEAIEGAESVVVHMYNPVSPAQRDQVFRGGRAEVKRLAVKGARLFARLAEEAEEKAAEAGKNCRIRFEYSPESFTATEPEFALEVCNAVLDEIRPTPDKKVIVNLPSTVETSLPHVFASQVEYMRRNLAYADSVILSVHPHNDRGGAAAAAETALLAGAERVEGTLFGNGERTGNVDLVTLALNLYSQGTDPGLNFENLPYVAAMYGYFTGMKVPPRQPYAGELVFAAFSGSHQDAIAKGIRYREEHGGAWNVPYLPVDPGDIGREYEKDVIRINSQSGKGGVGYVLENLYRLKLPARLNEAFLSLVKSTSEGGGGELKPDELYALFEKNFLDNFVCFALKESRYDRNDGIDVVLKLEDRYKGETVEIEGHGNGRLDAVSNALKAYLGMPYKLNGYEQHALGEGTSSKAVTYLSVETGGKSYWGAGIHDDGTTASLRALCAALNNLLVAVRGIPASS